MGILLGQRCCFSRKCLLAPSLGCTRQKGNLRDVRQHLPEFAAQPSARGRLVEQVELLCAMRT